MNPVAALLSFRSVLTLEKSKVPNRLLAVAKLVAQEVDEFYEEALVVSLETKSATLHGVQHGALGRKAKRAGTAYGSSPLGL